jgi:hypothetical protein
LTSPSVSSCKAKISSSASEAGVALPTDPAVLLSLGPIVQQLASALPTAPVLSVLETAVPSAFLSQIVHDPGFAQSFESAFAAGSSPSWFLGLPTEVKSYLHTYSGYGGIATAVGAVNSVESAAAAEKTSSMSASAAATTTVASQTGTQVSTDPTSNGATSGTSSMATMISAPQGTSTQFVVVGGSTVTPSGPTSAGSSVSSAGAAKESGLLAAGLMGVLGVLGAAVAL